MKVRFWGTRGSLPVAATAVDIRRKVIAALTAANGRQFETPAEIEAFADGLPFAVSGGYGGNTSCVELIGGGPEHVICDLGSGARPLGQAKMAAFGPTAPQDYHFFLSHLHWDHLMGLPFFVPLYIPGNRIFFYGCHAEMEKAIRLQMSEPCFPVHFEQIGAEVSFHRLEAEKSYNIAGFSVTAKKQIHHGDSYGYRFEKDGVAVVYSTDSEQKGGELTPQQGFVDFFHAADLVIFDAMYSLGELGSVKADWGHASNIDGVDLCRAAGARRLALFHHEPICDDAQLDVLLLETRRFEKITRDGHSPLEIISTYDGLTVEL